MLLLPDIQIAQLELEHYQRIMDFQMTHLECWFKHCPDKEQPEQVPGP